MTPTELATNRFLTFSVACMAIALVTGLVLVFIPDSIWEVIN